MKVPYNCTVFVAPPDADATVQLIIVAAGYALILSGVVFGIGCKITASFAASKLLNVLAGTKSVVDPLCPTLMVVVAPASEPAITTTFVKTNLRSGGTVYKKVLPSVAKDTTVLLIMPASLR
jgi:hypothetical protein